MKTIKNGKEWNDILREKFSGASDAYFAYEYFELYGRHYNSSPEGIFWEDENVKIFWTHLVRNINAIPQYKDLDYHDLITPYGYGGPLIARNTADDGKVRESLRKFLKEYKGYAFGNNYVCEFIRFHPILRNWEIFTGFFNIRHLNDVVTVNLKEDLEKIWNGISKGHKYNIKKTLRDGCKIKITASPQEGEIEDFINIYRRTMDRNQAAPKYYFSREFICDHFKTLNAILTEVMYRDKVIGSSIFVCGKKIVHYYLSGAFNDLKGVYPSNLMLWEAIKWAKENNFETFHLGGGVGNNDSLFEFKSGFSGDIAPFNVGEIIFNQEQYRFLTHSINNNELQTGYFPAYRRGLDAGIV